MKKSFFLATLIGSILTSCSNTPKTTVTITTDKETYSLGDTITINVLMGDQDFECAEWSISSTGDNGPTILEEALFQTPMSLSYGNTYVIDPASSPGTLNISVGACNDCTDFETAAKCSFAEKSVTVIE